MIKNSNIPYISTEINEIFNFMSKEMLFKIPEDVKLFFKKNSDPNYSFSYDQNKELKDQNIRKDTKEMLAIIYKEYICDEFERKSFIKARRKIDFEKEEEKRKKYDPNNIFPSRKEVYENKEIAIYKNNDSFIQKIIIFIKKIFNIK